MWALLRRPGDSASVPERDHVREHVRDHVRDPVRDPVRDHAPAGGIQGMLDAVEPVPSDAQPPDPPHKVDGHKTTLKKFNPLQGTQGIDRSTLRQVLCLDLRFRRFRP